MFEEYITINYRPKNHTYKLNVNETIKSVLTIFLIALNSSSTLSPAYCRYLLFVITIKDRYLLKIYCQSTNHTM